MVSEYLKQCGYNLSKLKNHIFLYNDVKSIQIDHQEAFISGATGTTTAITGFDISFAEETSLDERYKFSKTLKISVNGRIDESLINSNLYVIVEDYDGTYFLTNPDYPYKLTYQFNLAEGVNQTDITLTTQSNMPALKLNSDKLETSGVCKSYQNNGIKSLKLLEKEKVNVSTLSGQVVTTDEWKIVEFQKNSCSLTETYDGNNITTTIQFNISVSSYKSDWQYRLLEFQDNRYTAVIKANDYYFYYVGYENGLEANYSINTTSNNGDTDYVTITLTETSNYGLYDKQDLTEYYNSIKHWNFIKYLDGYRTYECYGETGWARFLVKAETDYFGNPTGKYMLNQDIADCLSAQTPCKEYSYLNGYSYVGTFQDYINDKENPNSNYFKTTECAYYDPTGIKCIISSNLPNFITFGSATSYTYNFKASCDWGITDLPEFITVSPMSGVAESSYTLTITNTLTPEETANFGSIDISCCNTVRTVSVNVQEQSNCVYPENIWINCLEQQVQFGYNGKCRVELTSSTRNGYDFDLTYTISDNQITVTVPEYSGSGATTMYELYFDNCDCSSEPTKITIFQYNKYTMWAPNCISYEDSGTCDYVCSGTAKYIKEYLWTGATSTHWTRTDTFRFGELIDLNSSDCNLQSRFQFLNHYMCVNGSKYKLLEEQKSLDEGATWTTTGKVKLGDWIEDNSSFCSQTTTYDWKLTDDSICQPT